MESKSNTEVRALKAHLALNVRNVHTLKQKTTRHLSDYRAAVFRRTAD